MSFDAVCYHFPCLDGFTAAWIVKLEFPDIEMIPCQHGKPVDFERLANKRLLFVDFSYKREAMDRIVGASLGVVVLDHHKSAQEDLAHYPRITNKEDAIHVGASQVGVIFDMERSGARLTWDFLHPVVPAPWLVRYVEDRDLWRKSLVDCEPINDWLFSFDYTIENWTYAHGYLESKEGRARAADAGVTLSRKKWKDINEMLPLTTKMRPFFGYNVPVANLPYTLASEAANKLVQDHPECPFAVCYWIRSDGKRVFSLRSIGEFDVSAVAKQNGGGGHRNAAGFESYNFEV